jgi:hemerythrin-like domain-containing protein
VPIRPDSLFAAAPSLDEPIEMLAACHGRIAEQCHTLTRLVEHLGSNGADEQASQAAQAVIRYFDTAGENHHRDEEEDLFPVLRRFAGHRALEVGALLAALLMEHDRMRTVWRDVLRPQLVAVAERRSNVLDAVQVQQFVKLYSSHIDRENVELLPLARTVLGDEELQRLGEAMAARRGVKPAAQGGPS